MKISVLYEHIEKACEQTKKPLEEVLAHVKKSGIDGIETVSYTHLLYGDGAIHQCQVIKYFNNRVRT